MKKILILLGIVCVFASCKKDTSLTPDKSKDSKTVSTKKVNDVDYVDSVYLVPANAYNYGVYSWTTIRAYHKANFRVDVYLTTYASPGHNLPQIPINIEVPFVSLEAGPWAYNEFGFADATLAWSSTENYLDTFSKVVTVKMTRVVNADTGEDITAKTLIGFPYTETVTYGGANGLNPGGSGVPPGTLPDGI